MTWRGGRGRWRGGGENDDAGPMATVNAHWLLDGLGSGRQRQRQPAHLRRPGPPSLPPADRPILSSLQPRPRRHHRRARPRSGTPRSPLARPAAAHPSTERRRTLYTISPSWLVAGLESVQPPPELPPLRASDLLGSRPGCTAVPLHTGETPIVPGHTNQNGPRSGHQLSPLRRSHLPRAQPSRHILRSV